MISVALKMLLRDKGKYFGIVMGVTLASMVITQQGSIFVGIMTRTFALISDMGDTDIWVMEPKVQFIDDTKPLQDTALNRVRGVPGVAHAAPLYKGILRVRLESGEFQNCNIIGIDDATLTGGRAAMIEGRIEDLRRADAVIVDIIGATTRLPGEDRTAPVPLAVGDTMELNDRRGVVVGISATHAPSEPADDLHHVQPRPVCARTQAVDLHPGQGRRRAERAGRVRPHRAGNGLAAYTRDQFKSMTVSYFINNTGIPINFGIAVSLGFIIGSVITGFMFYSFTADNLRYFGTLKAMGTSDGTLLRMIMTQAMVVGVVGFGLGTGAASWFGASMSGTPLAFRLTWELLFVAGTAVVVICLISAMLSMRRVITLEPAVVFKG